VMIDFVQGDGTRTAHATILRLGGILFNQRHLGGD
jgi:hypothetical protein